MSLLFFSSPATTLSMASSISDISTASLFLRAARSAASFTIFAKSAPTKPGVLDAITFRSTSGASLTFLVWIFKISSRPTISGLSTRICRSNLPGLKSAGSRISGLLVAAIMITPVFGSNPSISASN